MSAVALFDAPGAADRRRLRLWSAISLVAVGVLVGAILLRLDARGQFAGAKWEIFTHGGTLSFLAKGLAATLEAAALGAIGSFIVAVPLAFGRMSSRAWIRWPATAYVEFFRAVPLLLLILFVALGLPQLGIKLPALWFLVLSLTLFEGAMTAEIIRAGILALPRGQTEAALALGLSRAKAMRLVVLPQAWRIMLPALLTQLLILVQDTSLGYVIPYEELLRRGQDIASFAPESLLPSFIVVTAIYGVVSLLLLWLVRLSERRDARSSAVAAELENEVLTRR